MALDLNFGNAVTGAQRFSRPELEKRLLRTLSNSAGIKMFGLRRIGKSTLRLVAVESFENAGRPFIFVDAQGLHSQSDLLARLGAALPGEKSLMKRAVELVSAAPARTALEALAEGTPQEERLLSAYWRLISDAILAALKKAEGPKPALVIDEFSYLIDNMIKRQGLEDTDRLLASMREWRGAGMTMLLTGSLGITGLARKHGLNLEHLNDLQPFDAPELSEDEAREFIKQATEEPSKGKWTRAHTDEFLAQSGALFPCFLVRGLLEIGVEDPAGPESFAAIFGERVRPDLHADFFRQFDRRFKEYAGLPGDEQQKLVLPALKAIIEAESARPQDALPCEAPFTRVDLTLALAMLVEDGFIRFSEDAEGERLWKPASRLSKLWWKRSKLA